MWMDRKMQYLYGAFLYPDRAADLLQLELLAMITTSPLFIVPWFLEID